MIRRTKIICTLGPATDDPAVLKALIDAGMDVARLNFSHGTADQHLRRIALVREAEKAVERPIALLADLPGPKIRIGEIPDGPVQLDRNAPFTLTLFEGPGDNTKVHLPSPPVFQAVKKGDSLYLDDGLIHLVVTDRTEHEIITQVVNGGMLSSHKGLTLPGITLDMPSLTVEDLKAIELIGQSDVDWVAASFVRSPYDVRAVRDAVKRAGRSVPVIAKIEQHEAVDSLDAIIKEAEGIMVARGDLGVERPIWEVPILQKRIITLCNAAGKPVVTATQMLDSMIRNPRPTRAEVTDVANAVLDGTDGVMLSGETAVGKYPAETVQMMKQILLEAEGCMEYSAAHWLTLDREVDSVTDALSQATYDIAKELDVAAILTSTTSGFTARMVSRHRPEAPIIGLTSNPRTYRRLALTWGVVPALTPKARDTDHALEIAVQTAVDRRIVKEGDLVVITAGVPTGVAGNTNLLKVHKVGDPVVELDPDFRES